MTAPKVRCAIYTRKSSDEGLDQAFNSLDAQHEACAAYIASQKHEGWKMLPARYDDGGISGGTLERPGLQHLMADIDAGRVDMVVVYKIDRLTRSLGDFARLVERLDAANCSFVSVTQAFNTSSSMGRLTLNVLLSFAQFEREVTAERIRDKIAASKKKGLWMGGVPPLGYDPHPDNTRRELVVNPAEAERVTQIFELYATHGCLNAVTRETDRLGLFSKRHLFASGRVQGGRPFSRGQIYHLLTNPIYRGMIRHKAQTYPGLHPAIIDDDLWDKVQDRLTSASARKRGATAGQSGTAAAPLKGKIRDETGDLLTPSHTRRRGKQLRYYISNRLVSGGTDPTGWRLPARALETAVVRTVVQHLQDHADRHAVLDMCDATTTTKAAAAVMDLAARLTSHGPLLASSLISQATVGHGRMTLTLDRRALAHATNLATDALNASLCNLDVPFTCRRRGVENKIVAGPRVAAPDRTLITALRNGHAWSDAINAGIPLREIANRAGHSERYVARIITMISLSPKVQTAIVDGTQPVNLSLKDIMRDTIPLNWTVQDHRYGIGA